MPKEIHNYMNPTFTILGGIGFGAGLAFLLDPDRGRRRRAVIRDKTTHLKHEAEYAAGKVARDAGNRARGLAAEARHLLEKNDHPSDSLLQARVRAELGRAVSHPRALQVDVQNGRVTLSGPILASEAGRILTIASHVRGVHEVEDHLERHESGDGIPALQGGVPRERRPEFMQTNWAPAIRFMAGLTGAGLLTYAVTRRTPVATGLGVVGLGCLTRSVANREFLDLLPVASRGRAPNLTPSETL